MGPDGGNVAALVPVTNKKPKILLQCLDGLSALWQHAL